MRRVDFACAPVLQRRDIQSNPALLDLTGPPTLHYGNTILTSQYDALGTKTIIVKWLVEWTFASCYDLASFPAFSSLLHSNTVLTEITGQLLQSHSFLTGKKIRVACDSCSILHSNTA